VAVHVAWHVVWDAGHMSSEDQVGGVFRAIPPMVLSRSGRHRYCHTPSNRHQQLNNTSPPLYSGSFGSVLLI